MCGNSLKTQLTMGHFITWEFVKNTCMQLAHDILTVIHNYSYINIAAYIEITSIMECQISRVILSYNSTYCW